MMVMMMMIDDDESTAAAGLLFFHLLHQEVHVVDALVQLLFLVGQPSVTIGFGILEYRVESALASQVLNHHSRQKSGEKT